MGNTIDDFTHTHTHTHTHTKISIIRVLTERFPVKRRHSHAGLQKY